MRSLAIIAIFSLFLLISCCSTLSSKSDSTTPVSTAQNLPSQGKPDSYFDFKDILIPKEMKLVPKESLLFETPQMRAGVISFAGRVEPVSLFDFFIANMPKDNWRLTSYFKYRRYIMIFEKPEKDCVITIAEKALTTELELWITPKKVSK